MKKIILHLGLFSVTALCGFQLMAKPAKPGLLSVPTADGTHLTVRLAGDEFYHQYFTEDGYPLIERDGIFYYCDFDAKGNVINSGIKAVEVAARSNAATTFLSKIDKSSLESRISLRAEAAPRRANRFAGQLPLANSPLRSQADDNERPPYDRGYGLFPDLRFPAYGDQKAIVILVEYTDVKFHDNYEGGVSAIDYFTRMLNEDGFNDYGGTGSAAQFFRENSGNHFRPEFDVYGPITLSQNQAYYGGNDWSGDDKNPGAMVKEACDALDDIIDFNDYDRNNDGVVDNIFIFYAGMGEASGGSANTVWPHSWNMTSAGYPNLYYDGVKIHTYGCSNEWESGRPDGVGTFVHEFSHVMGLPDLYATSYTNSFTPGSWSALDYGPYNNNGMTPPNYGAFERYALGWLKPREMNRAVSATLQPVSENVCGVIRTAKDTEFFLVENRQKEGWDAYIPGHGMLVWHVDYVESVWSSNRVNNTPSHQYVDIEEADGSQSEYTRDGDSFPGSSNKTSFTSSTTPAMKTWGGQEVDVPLTNIAENNGIITFDILGGGEETVAPLQLNDPSDVTPDSFTLNWSAPDEGNDVILSVWYRKSEVADSPANAPAGANDEDDIVYVSGYRSRNMGNQTSAVVEGLKDNQLYHFSVQHSSGWTVSEPVEGSISTGRLTLDYYAPVALEASDVNSDSFVANWDAPKSYTEPLTYQISLYELEAGDPYEESNGFDKGLTMEKGWMSNAGNTYSMTSYVGLEAPSLRLSDGQSVTSPVYEDGVKYVKFWSRGNNTTAGDLINVYAVDGNERELIETVNVDKTVGGQTTEITSIPADTKQIEITFERNGNSGALALDDVVVGHGTQFDAEPVESFTNFNVGDQTSYKFENLKTNKDYAYEVRATDGELFSRVSNRIYVKTSMGSGVSSVANSAFVLNVAGLEVSAGTADEIIVADCTGAVVARGSYKVTLPRAGLYIISVPSQNFVKKLIAR